MIKVLHLTSSFGLGGGAETNLLRLALHADANRLCNTIVTMTEGVSYSLVRRQLKKAGVAVHSLRMRRGVADPLAALRLFRIIRDTRPLVLQTWMYHADLLGLIAAKWARVPSLAWNIRCSSLDPAGLPLMSRSVRRLLAWLSPYPDVVLVNSHSGAEFHRTLGYRPRKWMYMPNSLDLQMFKPDPEAAKWLRLMLNVPHGSQLVGLIARVHLLKDHNTFIRAASLLLRDYPNVHFVLAGKGAEESNDHVTRLIHTAGAPDRFRLLGHRSDANRIMAGLDVACSSSLGEGSPNVIAEAMACGVPCVVTDVGDSGSLVQGLGKVVPSRNAKALADACRELLELPAVRRSEIGAAARARAAEWFSLPRVVDRYQQLYEQLGSHMVSDKKVATE